MPRATALLALLALAGCYSPTAQPGAPCTPALGNCPTPQTCALVGTSYQCVTGVPVDAPLAPGPDAPRLADALGDSPVADAPAIDASTIDAPPAPTWTLVQSGGAQDDNPALVLPAPTGSGDLIVVAVQTNPGGVVTSVTDDASGSGNTYAAIPSSHATDTADSLAVELWVAAPSRPGAMTLTITASDYHAAVAWEVAGLRATAALDTVATLDDQTASTLPSGPLITTATADEFVLSAAIVSNNIPGIRAGNEFTNDQGTEGNGWAHLTNPRAAAGTHEAQWRQNPAGGYCAVAAAFFTAP
jgi:hypothetical protein